MGEYADMMLDGTCCAQCGEYLDNDDPLGIPEVCGACAAWNKHHDIVKRTRKARSQKAKPEDRVVECSHCDRKFISQSSRDQHVRATHPKTKRAK